MQALVWQGPRRMAIETHDESQPAADEALLRVRAAGVCGSELEGYLGLSSLRVPPLVMGHEFSGEIVTLNGDASGLHLGQVVTANPLVSCGQCPVCHTSRRYLCPHRTLIGAHRPGGFAAYVAVPIAQLIPLPEHLTPTLGALAEPFAVALHAVGLARLSPGEAVVVWGAGSIGLLTVCAARLARAEPIIAVDTNPARLAAATALGAHTTIDGRAGDAVAQVRRLVADHPFVTVFDAVGRSATREAAAAVASPGGRAVLIGIHDAETRFAVNQLVRAEVALLTSYAYTHAELERAVELLAAGALLDTGWIETRPLEAGPKTFAELVDTPGATAKVVLVPA